MTRQRGFTMVEVMVACAVIVVLMGLLFLGGRAIINNQKKSTTKSALNNLRAMVSEREAAVGAGATKKEIDNAFIAATLVSVPATPPPPLTVLDGDDIKNMGQHAADRVPTLNNHVGVTQNVLKQLSTLPANKKAIANFPKDQLMEKSTLDLAAAPYNVGVVILDGWDNPILAVPSSGVTILHETDAGTPRTVKSPDGKPFFMSAGPDGFFSFMDSNNNGTRDPGEAAAGDDNVYSYEN